MASEPEREDFHTHPELKRDENVTVSCPECGDLIEVADVAAVLRALHLMNTCTAMRSVLGQREA